VNIGDCLVHKRLNKPLLVNQTFLYAFSPFFFALLFLFFTSCEDLPVDSNSSPTLRSQNVHSLATSEEIIHSTRKALPDTSFISELPANGGDEFNRLIFESSPYLLQHARNPIDWYPWGEAAFKKALDEDKPIFMSIGYTTCHWCHVMEHESFEDKDVAALMNRDYVCSKSRS
jgi:thioredoxin-related protein